MSCAGSGSGGGGVAPSSEALSSLSHKVDKRRQATAVTIYLLLRFLHRAVAVAPIPVTQPAGAPKGDTQNSGVSEQDKPSQNWIQRSSSRTCMIWIRMIWIQGRQNGTVTISVHASLCFFHTFSKQPRLESILSNQYETSQLILFAYSHYP